MIRLKFFIPVVLLTALIAWIFIYRIDSWVKDGIENGISAITGTKTDISGLKLSLKNSALSIKKLEIASKSDPLKNSVEFETIVIDFQTLPLLQKRFVIDDFSILGIQWGTARKTSGILPPKPKSKEPSWFDEVTDEALDSLQAEFDKLPVSKLTEFSIPDDPKALLGRLELQSLETFKSVTAEIQEGKEVWVKRVKEAKDLSGAKRMLEDAKSVLTDLPQDPQEILKRVETVSRVISQLEVEKKKAEDLWTNVKVDYEKVQTAYNSAQAALEADYKKAKGLIGIDALDTKALMKIVFGAQWLQQAEATIRMQNQIRSKLQALSQSGKDDSIQIQPRAKGRDIIFVTEKKLPSFVLEKSNFTVNVLENGERGQIQQKYALKLKDLNSAPKLHGKPMSVDVEADFKEMMIGGAKLSALWDYTKEKPSDHYQASVSRIKAESWPVGIPKLFPIKMESGLADAKVDFNFVGPVLTWKNEIRFQGVKWNFSEVPKSGLLVPILDKVFSEVKDFTLVLKLSYEEKKLDFDISSDFDNALKRGISAYLDEKVKEIERKVMAEVDQRVGAVKAAAIKEINGFKADVFEKVEGGLQEIGGYIGEANGVIGELEKRAKDAAEAKVKSGIQDQLKKNLPKLPKLKF